MRSNLWVTFALCHWQLKATRELLMATRSKLEKVDTLAETHLKSSGKLNIWKQRAFRRTKVSAVRMATFDLPRASTCIHLQHKLRDSNLTLKCGKQHRWCIGKHFSVLTLTKRLKQQNLPMSSKALSDQPLLLRNNLIGEWRWMLVICKDHQHWRNG